MNSIANNTKSAYKLEMVDTSVEKPKPIVQAMVEEQQAVEAMIEEEPVQMETTENKIRKSFFDKYVDKIKDFLDNAE
jgi:cell division protein FtsA